jgi:molybdopterin converting factor small subunit
MFEPRHWRYGQNRTPPRTGAWEYYTSAAELVQEREDNMAILNYTTTVDSFKTVSEIERILMEHEAKRITKNYNDKSIVGLSFVINTGMQEVTVQLPARVAECLKVLESEKAKGTKNIKATQEQAERVAWRILKDWIEAQMALLDIQMVRFEEIFLPYIDVKGRTIYERLEERQFLLEEAN